jgi:hypothetical protein
MEDYVVNLGCGYLHAGSDVHHADGHPHVPLFFAREALAIVRDLAATGPPVEHDENWVNDWVCLLCDGKPAKHDSDGSQFEHSPECPYRRAIELMGPSDA